MRVFLWMVLWALSFVSYSANEQLNYEPQVVKLSGVIDLELFPGPPNYENIKKGDAAENIIFLKLDKPVDVVPAAGDKNELSVPEHNLNIIQVALMDEKDWNIVKEGEHMCIEGALFHEHTAHHHATVLISVQKIAACPKSKAK